MIEMSNYLPNRVQRTIIRSFAKTVRDAAKNFGKCPYDFLEKAVQSPLFQTFEEDYRLHSQSPNCIAIEFMKTFDSELLTITEEEQNADGEVGYWMGFVVMQYAIRDHFPMDTIKKIPMEEVYWAYDVLHTQDVNYAIRFILEEYVQNISKK